MIELTLVSFTPSLLTRIPFLSKFISGAPLQVDLTANFLFFEKLTAGAAYRVNGALTALVGFQVSDAIFLGYSYDMETSKLANYNSGSHEFFLRFEVFKKEAKVFSPRFF